jgi:hypothetical protein
VSLTLAGPVTLSLSPLAATVPLTLHLNNILLGANCTIGPVINLQLGLPSSSGNNSADLPAVLSEGVGVHA